MVMMPDFGPTHAAEKLFRAIRAGAVSACMWKLKQDGYVREVPIAGELKGWRRSE
jgi:hypothetical protein